MESDDYIRIYYQLLGGAEVLFGEIVDDAVEDDTYTTFTTSEAVEGDEVRIVIRAKNGISGDAERHVFDNIQFEATECYKRLSPIASEVTASSATVNWATDFDAVDYSFRYRVLGVETWSANSSDSVFNMVVNGTEVMLNGLLENTTYEFQVRAQCSDANTGYSPMQTFTTDYAGGSLGTCFVERDSSVTIEAEHYLNNLFALNTIWENYIGIASNDDIVDGVIVPINTSSDTNTGLATTGPRLDYNISFTTPGVYLVWVNIAKQNAEDGASSMHVGQNGQCISCRGAGLTTNNERFIWKNVADGIPVEFVVAEPGVQTLNVWMRNDGIAINKIELRQFDGVPGTRVAESSRNNCGTVLNSPNCISQSTGTLILNDRVANGLYAADNQIESTAFVASGNEVLMQATQTVTLQAGFVAEQGTHFVARIRPACPPLSSSALVEERGEVIRLHDNELSSYPNPFSEQTNIHYKVAKDGVVRMKLYNLSGELLQMLVDEYQLAGEYDLNPNVTNLVSGVYVLTLQVGEHTLHQKLLVVEE
jgi:hypothetical protein